jgi:cyclophilin family peptidyl-prolyl cis-trans isomerase
MARTNSPNSATSQFFVNLADNANLDRNGPTRGYAVFGSISSGTELITLLTNQPCVNYPALGLNGAECLPLPNLVITAATQTR